MKRHVSFTFVSVQIFNFFGLKTLMMLDLRLASHTANNFLGLLLTEQSVLIFFSFVFDSDVLEGSRCSCGRLKLLLNSVMIGSHPSKRMFLTVTAVEKRFAFHVSLQIPVLRLLSSLTLDS